MKMEVSVVKGRFQSFQEILVKISLAFRFWHLGVMKGRGEWDRTGEMWWWVGMGIVVGMVLGRLDWESGMTEKT